MYLHTGTYVHTYVHAYIHRCTYIQVHTYIHTYMHTYIDVRTYIQVHTYIHTYLQAYIHRCTGTYVRSSTDAPLQPVLFCGAALCKTVTRVDLMLPFPLPSPPPPRLLPQTQPQHAPRGPSPFSKGVCPGLPHHGDGAVPGQADGVGAEAAGSGHPPRLLLPSTALCADGRCHFGGSASRPLSRHQDGERAL